MCCRSDFLSQPCSNHCNNSLERWPFSWQLKKRKADLLPQYQREPWRAGETYQKRWKSKLRRHQWCVLLNLRLKSLCKFVFWDEIVWSWVLAALNRNSFTPHPSYIDYRALKSITPTVNQWDITQSHNSDSCKYWEEAQTSYRSCRTKMSFVSSLQEY